MNKDWLKPRIEASRKGGLANAKKHRYKGEYLSLRQISEKYKISLVLLKGRIKDGWHIKLAIETPKKTARLYTYNGLSKTLLDWSKELKINLSTLKERLQSGWGHTEAFGTKVSKTNRKRIIK